MLRRARRNGNSWMITYADLMSLLLCFFVMLVSFSEMDRVRFKEMAGQLSQAFGVQRDLPADRIPMGTSAALENFSPGEPVPIPSDEIRQLTTQEYQRLQQRQQFELRVEQRLDQVFQAVEQALGFAIDEGGVKVERDGANVRVRIDEQGTFSSGSADVTRDFAALLRSLSATLAQVPGDIVIDGHTDDVPIYVARFRSNWDLSAMRAATVANTLLENPELDPTRIAVAGHADTRPLAPNTSAESRANNRRVEITLLLGSAVEREVMATMSINP